MEKRILQLLTQNITIEYVNPEDNVVNQNDEDNGFFYFVYQGCFIVSVTKFGFTDGRKEKLRQL
jgi:hypothetical protein